MRPAGHPGPVRNVQDLMKLHTGHDGQWSDAAGARLVKILARAKRAATPQANHGFLETGTRLACLRPGTYGKLQNQPAFVQRPRTAASNTKARPLHCLVRACSSPTPKARCKTPHTAL